MTSDLAVTGKDFWDKADIVAKFASSVVIAGASLYLAHVYHNESVAQLKAQQKAAEDIAESQRISREMEVIQPYIKNLTSIDSSERGIAFAMVRRYGGENMTRELGRYSPISSVVDKLMAAPNGPKTKAVEEVAYSPKDSVPKASLPSNHDSPSSEMQDINVSSKPNLVSRIGWVYLGAFDKSSNAWRTRYFAWSGDANPSAITDGKIIFVGASNVNVRDAKPDIFGSLGRYVNPLKKGDKAQVVAVSEWSESGYMWARIAY